MPWQVSGPSGPLAIRGRGSPSLEEERRRLTSPSQLPTGAVARDGFSFTRIDEANEADRGDDGELSPQQVQRTLSLSLSLSLSQAQA